MAKVLSRRITGLFSIKKVKNGKEFSILTCNPYTSLVSYNLNRESVLQSKDYEYRHILSTIKYDYIRCYSALPNDDKDRELEKETKKLSIFQKFKQMYRDYWYVLLPVHIVTSSVWFGGFYYMAKSGIDIPAILESWHVSEKLVNPLRDSSMGYIAVSYALYKIATPARYTVTLGGTTISINYLKKWGYIKPVPSKERMKELYMEKKDTLSKSMLDTREDLREKKENIMETIQETKEELRERKDDIIETIKETKEELKEKKDHLMESISKTQKNFKKKKSEIKEKLSGFNEKT
ncbi:unnamed protein product [Phaedon cochleariae]|uniref:DUF1279 domain-containing protein n=1 Tax=Phaedon cochleariae TaxID=80249 RepID=A0A9P0GR72_PHACE|nr:unnamed protein product [Phaedon cochleariae]